jgi:multidrug efflux pump subunit AcrB
MGIVRFALRWPYTFYVLALLILFLGVTAFRSMPTDIFPEIDIPVVTVIWQYTGLSTPEMEQRVTTYSEYALSTAVSGIKDIEAQTLDGISVQKIYFQPDVSIDLAIAQIISATNYIRLLMPPGIQSPLVVQYNASSVPVLQISLSSDTLNEQQLYDYGLYNLRQRLAPIHGVTFPTPAGGKYRQIMVDLDPAKLLAKGLTPLDVANAVNAQNLTLPSGTAKIGDTQYTARTNAVPATIDDLNNIPVKYANGGRFSSRISAMSATARWRKLVVMDTGRGSKSCPSPRNLLRVSGAGKESNDADAQPRRLHDRQPRTSRRGRRSARPGVEPCGRTVRTMALPQRDQRQFCLPRRANGGRDTSAAPHVSAPTGRALRGTA